MQSTNLHVVEYSPEQQAYHVDTLDRVLRKNLEMVEGGRRPEYVPLGVFASSDEAHAWLDSNEGKRLPKSDL